MSSQQQRQLLHFMVNNRNRDRKVLQVTQISKRAISYNIKSIKKDLNEESLLDQRHYLETS